MDDGGQMLLVRIAVFHYPLCGNRPCDGKQQAEQNKKETTEC